MSQLFKAMQQASNDGGLKAGEITIANISDVHLGHGRVPTTKILERLDTTFSNEGLAFLDVIVISGDLFDKRLPHDGEDAVMISRWARRFLLRCAKNGVALRILEGTPSHDQRQSRWILEYNEMTGNQTDVKYYESITIDELVPGGPTVLYIPDEVNHDANKTWNEVVEYMREHSYTSIDFAVMHGMFTFQEPIRSVTSHIEERYESIVKHRIMIGHHHTHAQSGKIVVPGSIERLRHNEEEDKGHYQFSFSKTRGLFNEYFIINEQATVFTTFNVEGKSYEEVRSLFSGLEHLPNGSHLRLKLSRNDDVYASMVKFKNEFPHFKITTKPVEAEAHIHETIELVDRPVMTSIRPDTIEDLLWPKIGPVSDKVKMAIDRVLKACGTRSE